MFAPHLYGQRPRTAPRHQLLPTHNAIIALAVIAILSPGRSQSLNQADDRAEFDVASLKPAPPTSGPMTVDLGNSSHGRLTLMNVTLSECLRFAFHIFTDDQIVGPDWIKDHRALFNIVAQASPDTPRDRLRQMALTLLTERFRLTLHHEVRVIRYLALVVDKDGLKMHETKGDAPLGRETVRPGRIVYQHVSAQTLAVLLTRFTDQPILDMTGLKGQYDVDLQWMPERSNVSPLAEPQTADAAPSLFAATRGQLGLKLEARKDPLDVIVVDHAERIPLGN
jgi:uncharacterized protein (TIGR03435 family)